MSKFFILGLMILSILPPLAAAEESPKKDLKTVSATFNLGEFVAFAGVAKAMGLGDGLFLPFHFDVNYLLSRYFQLNLGLVYRYDSNGTFAGYHEFLGMVGGRFSFKGTGLTGGYLSLKLGPGYAGGPYYSKVASQFNGNYSAFELGIQPEAGYALALGSNGILSFGAGLLVIVPLSTSNAPEWSTLGYIVHRYVPMLNVGLGVQF